jgi:hypothetical protein
MSLISPLGRGITNQLIQNALEKTHNTTAKDFDALIALQTKILNRQEQPFTFIQSNNNALSSNVADGVMIIQSAIMNHGEIGVVQDLNVNFTTVAGTVRIVKISGYNSSNILVDVVRTITASTSGIGSVTLEEGEAIAVVGQVAGAGVLSVFFSGKKYYRGN